MKTRLKKLQETLASAASPVVNQVRDQIPARLRDTVMLRAFGLAKIPVLFFISPSVLELTDERVEVKVPLNRRTRNHVGSMYFGVLAAGADAACGLLAMRIIEAHAGGEVGLIFKDFHADFLKRATADVVFTCEQGEKIREVVEAARTSGERKNLPVQIVARVPSQFGEEPVAQFTLTLSLKKQ